VKNAESLSHAWNTSQLVFLGTAGCIRIPAFFCKCAACFAARENPDLRRTRASIAILGREISIVDPGPDLEEQLAREGIDKIDRIFVTHWHFDHIAGIGALGEISSICQWPRIDVYVPHQAAYHFDEELAYMKGRLHVHSIAPGDRLELPDGTWRVVKTEHTDHSVGFVVKCSQKFAYLVDGVVPPSETLQELSDCDILIIEATMDALDEDHWKNFSVEQAIAFWESIGISRCFLTHLSCHSWQSKSLVPGMSPEERRALEHKHKGLVFARDGMRISLT
jgi:phosphoribosyl 1,2-cyclic phosphate phosphodiesterase